MTDAALAEFVALAEEVDRILSGLLRALKASKA